MLIKEVLKQKAQSDLWDSKNPDKERADARHIKETERSEDPWMWRNARGSREHLGNVGDGATHFHQT